MPFMGRKETINKTKIPTKTVKTVISTRYISTYKVIITVLMEEGRLHLADVRGHPGSLGPIAASTVTGTGKSSPRGCACSTPARDPLLSKDAALSPRQLVGSSCISRQKVPREGEPRAARSHPSPCCLHAQRRLLEK